MSMIKYLPGVIQPAPPGVGSEGVVCLMSQRGAVLVSPPHVLRYVEVQGGAEVHLVVRPLVLAVGAGPGPVEDGDQVALGELSPGEQSLPSRVGGGEPHLHPPVLQTVRLQGGERYPVL